MVTIVVVTFIRFGGFCLTVVADVEVLCVADSEYNIGISGVVDTYVVLQCAVR